MAVTKRTRYEVLRRDNHTCRYCGATAPNVPLRIDHVTPVALGGTDNPDNLVTACQDCNAGKSSTSPDASLVADVREDALRHAELTRQAYAVLVERMGSRDDYIEEWAEAWERGVLPADWRNTISRWFEMGVPLELVTDAARIASTRTTVQDSGRFAYMCGIVWNQVTMIDELAETKRALEGRFWTEEALCDERIAAWQQGYDSGKKRERQIHARLDPVSWVVDLIDYPPTPWAVPA